MIFRYGAAGRPSSWRRSAPSRADVCAMSVASSEDCEPRHEVAGCPVAPEGEVR